MRVQLEQLMTTPKSSEYKTILGPCAYVFTSSNTGSWRIERPRVDFSACIQCGTCRMYCPADVITIHKDSSRHWSFSGITARAAASAPMNVPSTVFK